MKKFKVVLFLTVILLLAALPFFCTSAAPVVVSIDDLLITINADSFDGTTPVTVTADISTLAKTALGENGGKLEVEIVHNAPEDAGVTYGIVISPSSEISPEDDVIKVTITFSVSDKSKLTDFEITSATLTATPVVASPDPSGSTEPSGSVEPSAASSPTAEVSPTPTEVIVEITPTPTPKPNVTPEPTKDTYTSSSQTQAPPTLSLPPELTINPDELATPVPEITPEPEKRISSSPSLSFIILFAVLILLLAVDLFLIYWRKQMGYGTLINNGISRRKVRDDLMDYPENTETSDLDEAINLQDENQ